jgi:hypothetical protein
VREREEYLVRERKKYLAREREDNLVMRGRNIC